METTTFDWLCKHTWRQSAKNTAWCLLGCSIGDFGTILFFQLTKIPFPVLAIMILAIINGLITSIILETIILIRQSLEFNIALKTALGMSFISMISMETTTFDWSCKHTWKQSAKNTAWCLLGCSIGDFGTILFFQLTQIPFPVLAIMTLAIINGIITSIILETIILIKQNFTFKNAFKTAVGMSLISMISMEAAMNLTDYLLTGGAMLTWWVVPIMLAVGFVTPWPYNYWRLKKFNQACH